MPRVDKTFSTSDLSRKSGDIIAEALRRPVTITQRNKPRLILLNIDEYRTLRARASSRQVGTLETMPDDLFAEFEKAIEAYAAEDEPPSA
jgi:prevent-host-death family protein